MPQFSFEHYPGVPRLTASDLEHARNHVVQYGPRVSVMVTVPDALAAALIQEGKPVPQPHQGWALIDTGATGSCVDTSVVAALGLPSHGIRNMTTPSGGSEERKVRECKLAFPGSTLPVTPLQSVVDCDIASQGITVLLGRDFLQDKILIYNGLLGTITLTF